MLKTDNSNCTGCRVCEQLCPIQCIKMIQDSEGFIIPHVDNDKCIKCGLCIKKCPQKNEVKIDEDSKEVYALKLKNDKLVLKSSSGGAFAGFAIKVLKRQGVVFGCTMSEDFYTHHICINNVNELYKLQGSKYVQSDTKATFSEAKEYLNKNKLVLYSGTPCQIAGLKTYLGRKYNNLITIDLICHGVPSPLLFRKYIEWLENEIKDGNLLTYDFRNKEKSGWGLTYKAKTKTKTKYITSSIDPYYSSFLKGYDYRECCYNCKYCNNRPGDITIGDFWGIDKEHPDFYDEKGVSAIIINSKTGKLFFESVKSEFEFIESNYDKLSTYNKNLLHPTKRPDRRNEIYKEINDKDSITFVNDNLKPSITLINRIGALIPKKIKVSILKLKERI